MPCNPTTLGFTLFIRYLRGLQLLLFELNLGEELCYLKITG